ncbi:XopAW family type III secretion system calcium-binding effector [Curvibacter sp. APW13]|uniref:XopAW family type III secretion system calcium-binding effector n=1 Tax=Curvibacter sp. APW13 TaxID=3077236 RepID=UPI0028DD8F7A|nr:XopAW family type III secretion system calcium-binding effector [Curvibacter sp. APW13]MDT8992351.1 XopAW family type III secretion system calcium-binding effector [Curvibacter sp. APW13]
MSSISNISSGNAWSAQRASMQTRMFAKVDTDSSGGVDASELQTMLEDVSKHTGVSFGKTAQELLTAMDSDGNGSLNSDELAQGMQSVMPPPPSTMDFAQSRSGAGDNDDLFSRVDTDGDGSVSKSEMSDFVSKMGKNSDTSEDKFSQLDTDGSGSLSQSEFEAGRPQPPQGGGGMQGAGGPQGAAPMGPPPGGAQKAESSASSSTTYDPLDTNQDGVVSEMERLAGALKDLAQTASDKSTASGDASQALIATLGQKLYDQISTNWLTDKGASSLSATA